VGLFSFLGGVSKELNDDMARQKGYNDGYSGRAPNMLPIFLERLKVIYMESYKLGQQRAAIDKGSTVLLSPPQ